MLSAYSQAQESAAVAFTVLGLAALALVLGACLRWVPPGTGVVVVRRGRVVRTSVSGLVGRVPLLDEVHEWPTEPCPLPLTVRTDTRDGVEVRVLAEISVRVAAPQPGTSYVDPVRAVERAAEDHLAAAVEARDVEMLLDPERGLAVSLAGLDPGAELMDAEIVEVEALLVPGPDGLGRGGHARGPE